MGGIPKEARMRVDQFFLIVFTFLMIDKGILLNKEGKWFVFMNPTSLQRYTVKVKKNKVLDELIKKDMHGLYRFFSLGLEKECKEEFYCEGEIKSYSRALGPHEL